ncbi:MAG: hypothetical protein CYPHOPRED_004150, partial [Cyphobasidiales sp. Tagirdzhanova-0007]
MGEPWSMALDLWPDKGAIDVSDGQGNAVATIPIGFLESDREDGANMRNWSFIYHLVGDCVSNAGVLLRDGEEDRDPIREDSKAA